MLYLVGKEGDPYDGCDSVDCLILFDSKHLLRKYIDVLADKYKDSISRYLSMQYYTEISSEVDNVYNKPDWVPTYYMNDLRHAFIKWELKDGVVNKKLLK